jgi:hypothetical protein
MFRKETAQTPCSSGSAHQEVTDVSGRPARHDGRRPPAFGRAWLCRRSVLTCLAVALLASSTGCGRITGADRAVVGASKPGQASIYATISPGPPVPPLPFVSGPTVVGLPDRPAISLAAVPAGGLMGWLSPIALLSPDAGRVAYNTFTYRKPIDPEKSWSDQGIHPGDPLATPSIRLVDLQTGKDSVLAEGAFSLAWRADGAIAYFQGQSDAYRADEPFLGTVMVRPSPEGEAEAWSDRPDRYIVAAWAGSRLLVYRESEGEWLDLLVFDGPGRGRVLAPGASLVAVSPDGSEALVSQAGQASLIDVASGSTLARLDLDAPDPTTGQPLRYLAYGGSWIGDLVAAEGGPGLVLLRLTGSSIAVEDAVALPPAEFPMPPHEPRLRSDGTGVVAWVPIADPNGQRAYAYLDCDLATHDCVEGPVLHVSGFYALSNPSRPLP